MAEPQNLEAERAVLGAVLLAPEAFDLVAPVLCTDDFYQPSHRLIWEAFGKLKAKASPIDAVTVEATLGADAAKLEGGGLRFLASLAESCPTWTTAGHYAALVREKAVRRRLGLLCSELRGRALGDEVELGELLGDAQRQVFRLAMDGRGPRAAPVAGLVDGALDIIERRETRGGLYGFPTGLRVLDDVLGELQPENLVVVAARPGMGKTAFAVNVAIRGALQGLPSIFFSLEMSEQELVERMLAYFTGIPVQRIHAANPRRRLTGPEWVSLQAAQAKIAALPIDIRAGAMRTGEVVAEARQWRSRHPDGPALVVVDYVQLIKPDRRERGQSKESIVSEATEALKELGKELRTPVMGVAQLNREAEKDDREPKLSDLRDSGMLEQTADAVLFIHRDERDENKGGLGKGAAKLRLRKHRHGMTGSRIVQWNGPTNVFSDPPDLEPVNEQLPGVQA